MSIFNYTINKKILSLEKEQYYLFSQFSQITECKCCGRECPKGTVELVNEKKEVFHFGVVCAANALRMSVSEVKDAIAEEKAIKKRMKKVSENINSFTLSLAKIEGMDKESKSYKSERKYRELQLLHFDKKCEIDMLNDIFLPMNYEIYEEISDAIIYSFAYKLYYYSKENMELLKID